MYYLALPADEYRKVKEQYPAATSCQIHTCITGIYLYISMCVSFKGIDVIENCIWADMQSIFKASHLISIHKVLFNDTPPHTHTQLNV